MARTYTDIPEPRKVLEADTIRGYSREAVEESLADVANLRAEMQSVFPSGTTLDTSKYNFVLDATAVTQLMTYGTLTSVPLQNFPKPTATDYIDKVPYFIHGIMENPSSPGTWDDLFLWINASYAAGPRYATDLSFGAHLYFAVAYNLTISAGGNLSINLALTQLV